MSLQQALRSITVEDLAAMELWELETLVQLGSSALVAKTKQTVQDRDAQISTLQQEHRTLVKFEPRVLECFVSSPVKLNVGGTYFSTSMENLTKESNTFFSAMFSGRWEVKTDPHDKAVFVDRSPLVFEFIIDYMRTGEIDLDDLSSKQRRALHTEADFYQIASLLKLFLGGKFAPKIKGNIQLSQGNSRATYLGDEWGSTISLVAFSPSVREMKIKLVKGNDMLIGAAPKSILKKDNDFSICGWHVYASNGSLYSQNGDHDKPFKHKINEGSVVTVKLDEEFNISFQVDEEDWGIAYRKVAQDHSVPLHLSIGLLQLGAALGLL